MMIDVEITRLAEIDIAEVLYYSENHFGTVIKNNYLALIDQAINDIAKNPKRLGAKAVGGRPNYYCYHLSHSKNNVKGQRIKKLSHSLIFYRQSNEKLVIARLLHERMLIERHID